MDLFIAMLWEDLREKEEEETDRGRSPRIKGKALFGSTSVLELRRCENSHITATSHSRTDSHWMLVHAGHRGRS